MFSQVTFQHLSAVCCLLTAVACACGEPVVTPKYQQIKYYTATNVQCAFNHALIDCKIRISEDFYRRYDVTLDFSRGAASEKVKLEDRGLFARTWAKYYGAGLSMGFCGVQLDKMMNGAFLVECFGRLESGAWDRGFGLLASTTRGVLPWSAPKFPLLLMDSGSTMSMSLHSSTAWIGCEVKTPYAGWVALTPNQPIPRASRYLPYLLDQDRGGCGFQLPNVQERDSGIWSWYGEKRHTAVWHMSLVIVKVAPQGKPTLSVRHYGSGPLKEGVRIYASCSAPPAAPPVTMTWLLGWEIVRQDDLNDTMASDLKTIRPWQSLPVKQTITRVLKASDIGKVLRCTMFHPALSGSVSSESALRNFERPQVVAERAVVRTAEGHQVELACLVESWPEAAVSWQRQGAPVVESRMVTAGTTGNRHWLQLEDVAINDLTNFTCVAKNSEGSASEVVKLTGMPGEPVNASTSSGSVLAWDVESYAPLTATSLKTRQGQGPWKEVRTQLTKLRKSPSTMRVSHKFSATVTGKHSAYLTVSNKYGKSPTSSVHHFTATAVPLTKPKTSPTCSALTSKTVNLRCSRNKSTLSCAKPVPSGTKASFSCKPGFRLPEPHPGFLQAECSSSRRWSKKLFECVPDCGRRNVVQARLLVSGGRQAAKSEFPWHAAIFSQSGKTFNPICGGSLVTAKFVVTAAHCIWNDNHQKTFPGSQYRVVLGKHSREWNVHDPGEQRFQVAKLHVAERYLGSKRNQEADIAVVALATPAQLSVSVNVVCINWEAEIESQHFAGGINGTVPGWGLTESSAPSSTLRYVELPFVTYHECHNSVPKYYRAYITIDKICAGFRARSTSVCAGDSGGGLVFPSQSTRGDRYYLRGVVSSAPQLKQASSTKACQAENHTAFTAIFSHMQWLKKVLFGIKDADH